MGLGKKQITFKVNQPPKFIRVPHLTSDQQEAPTDKDRSGLARGSDMPGYDEMGEEGAPPDQSPPMRPNSVDLTQVTVESPKTMNVEVRDKIWDI